MKIDSTAWDEDDPVEEPIQQRYTKIHARPTATKNHNRTVKKKHPAKLKMSRVSKRMRKLLDKIPS